MTSDAIASVKNLTDLQVIEESLLLLLKERRKEILWARKKAGQQVGFTYTQGRGSKKASVRCNATINEFKGDYCVVNVVAPIRFATAVIQIEQSMLVEPHQIVEKVESEISHDEGPPEGRVEGEDDPLGGALG